MSAPACPILHVDGAPPSALLVIGYGNDLRSDDGAGIRAAKLIAARSPMARVIATRGLTGDLAGDIAAAARVVFIDAYAATEGGAPLCVERISPGVSGAPVANLAGPGALLAHHGDPAALVALAARLFGSVVDAWVLAIPAFCFAAGETISPQTKRRIDQAVALCADGLSSGLLMEVEDDRGANQPAPGSGH